MSDDDFRDVSSTPIGVVGVLRSRTNPSDMDTYAVVDLLEPSTGNDYVRFYRYDYSRGGEVEATSRIFGYVDALKIRERPIGVDVFIKIPDALAIAHVPGE